MPDLRNSKVVDLVRRLQWLGHEVTIHDPIVDPSAAAHEHGLDIDPEALGRRYDVVIAAVPHRAYRAMDSAAAAALALDGGMVADLHGIWRGGQFPAEARPVVALGVGADAR